MVMIFNTPTSVDFIPANGEAYPLAVVTVPQDVYTSAKITLTAPVVRYTFLLPSGSVDVQSANYSGDGAVLTLAQPLTIVGRAMGMNLSLDVSKSLTINNYNMPSLATFSGNPTLALTAFPLHAESTTPLNGKCNGLNGQIAEVNAAAGTMTVTLAGDGAFTAGAGYASGASIHAALSSATVYQGVSSAGGLVAGMFVNFDLALLPDGSYTATRVEVNDPSTTNMTTAVVQFASPQYTDLTAMPYQYQGSQLEGNGGNSADVVAYVYTRTTTFQTAAELAGFPGLPFTPSFSGTSLIPGQMTSIGAFTYTTMNPNYTQPTSVTLRPQTIDAVVTGSSTSGGYSVYTVQLVSYDPIVSLNGPPVNPNQVPVPQPGIVTVYTNSSTSLINTTTPAIGGTYRFHGLLLEDNGALRMVADQVSDGVAQ